MTQRYEVEAWVNPSAWDDPAEAERAIEAILESGSTDEAEWLRIIGAPTEAVADGVERGFDRAERAAAETVIRSHHLGSICTCCTLALANGDTSGCEHGCPDGHADRLCQFGLEPGENAVVGDSEGVRMFRCVGCGDDVMDWAYEVHILTERPEPEDNS